MADPEADADSSAFHGVVERLAHLKLISELGLGMVQIVNNTNPEQWSAFTAGLDWKSLNVLIGMPTMQFTVAQLQDMGVTRISLGGSLARVAYGAMMRAASEISTQGTFQFTTQAASGKELNAIFSRGTP